MFKGDPPAKVVKNGITQYWDRDETLVFLSCCYLVLF